MPKHDTLSLDCWCCPTLEKTCPMCHGEPGEGCPRCGTAGNVPASRNDPRGEIVVIHRVFLPDEDAEANPEE